MEQEKIHIRNRVNKIKHKLLVLSGKGGVGKSTVSANIAVSLALAGKKVGLLDIDIHGPSIPKILNLENKRPTEINDEIIPIELGENLTVMSMGFMLEKIDSPVIWRGPMKYQMIKHFIKNVKWGELDYLVVDSPPGTGDEPLSIVQLLEKPDGAVIVTTPQQLAIADVRKSINFCKSLNLPVIGIVENMSGLVCPDCGKKIDIFKTGGGQAMAEELGIKLLAKIPIDPQIVEACDDGKPYIENFKNTKTAEKFGKITEHILNSGEK